MFWAGFRFLIPTMLIWITGVSEERDELALWGAIMGGGYGFGDATRKRYQGKMMAIEGSGQKTIFEGDVGLRHTSKWVDWILQPPDTAKSLSLPFLLTSNLEHSLVYKGKVEIDLHLMAQSDDQCDFKGPIPLRDKYSGLVAVLDECSPKGGERLVGLLMAFAAESTQRVPIIGTEWEFLEVEGTLGTVNRELERVL